MLISVIMHSIALAMYACLEEVVWCSAGHHRLTGTRARIELKEGVLQMLIFSLVSFKNRKVVNRKTYQSP